MATKYAVFLGPVFGTTRAWPGLLEGSHLLAKGQVLQDKFRPRSAERADELDHDGEEEHE